MMFRSLAIMAFFLCSSLLSGRGRPFADAGRQVVNVNTDRLTRATLTVVTFNMLHGYGSRLNDSTLEERLELLAAGIAKAKPDVVLLHEASVTPGRHGNVAERLRDALNERLRGEEISYNSVFAMANGSRLIGLFEGSALLSRFQILSADSLVYAAQALIPPERRIALRARVATGGETGEAGARSIEIIGTHLTNTEARKKGRLTRTPTAAWRRWNGSGPSSIAPSPDRAAACSGHPITSECWPASGCAERLRLPLPSPARPPEGHHDPVVKDAQQLHLGPRGNGLDLVQQEGPAGCGDQLSSRSPTALEFAPGQGANIPRPIALRLTWSTI